MFNFFKNIGIITLVFLSFFYTEKLVNVVKEYDNIMIEIKERENEYLIKPIEAIKTEDTFIPGVHGTAVDIDKSYAKMRQYGKYNESLLEYKEVLPTNLLKDNIDKYIIKGGNKNQVTIIYLVNYKDDITKLIKNLEEIKINLFVDSVWSSNNEQEMINLSKQGFIFGNLSYNNDYTNSKFKEIDNRISQLIGQKMRFCYLEEKTKKALEICSKNNNYTIIPNIIIKNNTLSDLKKNLESGSIISVSNMNLTTFKLMIEYIQNKGYKIVDLKELLTE